MFAILVDVRVFCFKSQNSLKAGTLCTQLVSKYEQNTNVVHKQTLLFSKQGNKGTQLVKNRQKPANVMKYGPLEFCKKGFVTQVSADSSATNC